VLWAPGQAWWWTAVLFAAGSICFLVAPVPAFLNWVGPQPDAVVFFVGSLLFTTAALLQWLECVHTETTSAATPRRSGAAFWNPHRIDWCSSTVQLIGTLFFNATTFRALSTALDSPSYDRVVWRPDALGSICVLVSGVLAYIEVAGRLARRPPRTIEGAVVGVNLLGCVLFGLAALGAYVLPTTHSEVNVTIANVTTSLGALAFLVGAALLLPERAEAQRTERKGHRDDE
jgi:hypothetical protein